MYEVKQMKIVIMSAMNEEIKPTIDAFKPKLIDKINNEDLYKYEGKNTYYFINSGIGKVNAAITTSLVINNYQPDLIVSIGTAGGLAVDMQVSDIVVADKMAFWDVNVEAFGYELGQLPQMPKYFEIENYQRFYTLLENLNHRMHVGTIVTGDSFINQSEQRQYISENFSNVLAVEMESTSIVMTAQKLNVDCVVLRTISDLADQTSDISFDQYLAIVSEKFKELVEVFETNDWK